MKSRDILKRIDAEIDQRRREIAVHQLEIYRLEESRQVFMKMVEDDMEAAQRTDGHHPTLGNGHKPVLIARKVGTAELLEADEAEVGELITKGNRKGLPRLRSRTFKRGEMRQRILALLEPGDEPMTPKEIGNNLGLSAAEEVRKPLWNVLWVMTKNGQLQRDADKRYYRPRPQ